MRIEFAEALEEMGYGSFWLPNFISREIHGYDCLDLLSAVAARTKRIKLGTIVLQIPLYHPVDLARRVVTLDHLSNGRFILGTGVGGHPTEFEHLGVPYAGRGARVDESLEIMRRLWTEDEVTYEGKFYQLREVVQKPKPVQKPHPKILVGGAYHGPETREAPGSGVKMGFSTVALRRASRWNGWLPGGGVMAQGPNGSILEQGMEQIRAAAQAEGRAIVEDQYDVTVSFFGRIHIHDDREKGMGEVREWYNSRVARGYHQVQGNPSLDGLRGHGGMGTPKEVARLVNIWLQAGRQVQALKRVVIMFASLKPLEQLERFHRQVKPLLEGQGT